MRNLRILTYETPQDPYMNLAFEEAFTRVRSKDLTEDTLRIWRNKDAVIIGYFQYADEVVDLERARELGIKVVRRFTGGGAVYHDLGNINYALAIKDSVENVGELYKKYVKGILEALKILGFDPYVENINDVVVEDHKVSGTAASFRWNTSFFHGAMLVSTDLNRLVSVLKVSKKKLEDKKVLNVKYRVTNLQDVLKRKIENKELVESIVKGFEKMLNAQAYFDIPTKEELLVANILYNGKYSKDEWNLKRLSFSEFEIMEKKIDEVLK